MEYISLSRVPNQAFTIFTNGMTLAFTLNWFRDQLYVTVDEVGGDNIVTSERACDRQFILPERIALRGDGGNFRFEDDNREYPDYRNFNRSCVLVKYSADEIAALGVA